MANAVIGTTFAAFNSLAIFFKTCDITSYFIWNDGILEIRTSSNTYSCTKIIKMA